MTTTETRLICLLDRFMAQHDAEQHMGGPCDCSTCHDARALLVALGIDEPTSR